MTVFSKLVPTAISAYGLQTCMLGAYSQLYHILTSVPCAPSVRGHLRSPAERKVLRSLWCGGMVVNDIHLSLLSNSESQILRGQHHSSPPFVELRSASGAAERCARPLECSPWNLPCNGMPASPVTCIQTFLTQPFPESNQSGRGLAL